MKLPIKLQDLLQQNEATIRATSTLLGQKTAVLDCDLIKSHVYSIWLAHTGQDLKESMNQILDLDLDGYPLKDTVRSQLTLTAPGLTKCLKAAEAILTDTFCQIDLKDASWYSVDWLRHTLENALSAFDRACDRWRILYGDAFIQLEEARRLIDRSARGSVTPEERNNADFQNQSPCGWYRE